MKRFNSKVLMAGLLLLLLPVLSGCDIFDKLEARDRLNKGVQAYTSQQYPVAATHFKEAIKLDPNLIEAYLYLATTYRTEFVPGIPTEENLQRAELAIQTFEQVLGKDPSNVNAMANIAGLYSGMDEPDLAIKWYQKRLEVEPDNPEPYYGIGTINYKQVSVETGLNGENAPNLEEEKKAEVRQVVDAGVDALNKALELNPRYSQAMEYLNLLYRERSYLADDDEEKRRWQREADKLALRAIEIKRELEAEEERRRRSFTGSAEKND